MDINTSSHEEITKTAEEALDSVSLVSTPKTTNFPYGMSNLSLKDAIRRMLKSKNSEELNTCLGVVNVILKNVYIQINDLINDKDEDPDESEYRNNSGAAFSKSIEQLVKLKDSIYTGKNKLFTIDNFFKKLSQSYMGESFKLCK